MSRLLPEFEFPPVVEVALSVQFERLDVSTPQLGMVWSRFRHRFEKAEDQPEIKPTFERFGLMRQTAHGVRIEVGNLPGLRFWFSNESGHELVQVQRDRFVRNWRKTEKQPRYPRYSNLRTAFQSDWKEFEAFVTDELGTTLVPNQCEVTYVNVIEDIEAGRLSSVLHMVNDNCTDDYLGDPESAELHLHFCLKDQNEKPWGRLHIEAAPAVRATDHHSVLRLNLTARCRPSGKTFNSMMASLDSCHEAVVRGFASITTAEMHKIWKRTQ